MNERGRGGGGKLKPPEKTTLKKPSLIKFKLNISTMS